MSDMILALNCGSSSIKFKLFQLSDLKVLISGSASKVDSKGQKPSIKLVVHHVDSDKEESQSEEEKEGMEYDAVFQRVIQLIEEKLPTALSTDSSENFKDRIKKVAHRVVHGGAETKPMAIWPGHDEGLTQLDKLGEFAPLHNHRAVQVVKSCLEYLPKARQILLFDTLFHQSLPPHIYTYPLAEPASTPPIPLRKYGAHGLSYASVLTSVSKHLQKPESDTNIVIAHLGSGASVCAIKQGKSLDTSMGLTPLDGLPGGTRTGSVDPVLIFHHTPDATNTVDFKGTSLTKGEMIMNKEGGFQAIAGTNDFGTISARAKGQDKDASEEDTKSAKLAYDLFLDRLVNYVGAYVVKLLGQGEGAGLDGIILSGGIGEKGLDLRRDLGAYFEWLGLSVDDEKNKGVGKGEGADDQVVWEITKDGSKVKMFVCMTDEETQCAKMAKEVKTE